MNANATCLVADVGGTNTRVAVFDGQAIRADSVRRFRNADFHGLDDVLRKQVSDLGLDNLTTACVAVAGPVEDGVGRLTNLDWAIDAALLKKATGAAQGYVINDLEAQGHALDDVTWQPLLTSDGRPLDPDGSRLVIGVGTGFNAAPVHGRPGARSVVPSECGHISLPVWDEDSYALSRWVAERCEGFASVEEVLSGRGLPAIYQFYSGEEAPRDGKAILSELREPGAETARRSIDMFCHILGRVAGDLALVHLPRGGIYLIGGMARAVENLLADHGFAEGFLDKGRFRQFNAAFQVFLVDDDYAALTGCMRFADNHV
ncbi:glucokinase [Qingshengfaniella alkalisoli]|uniref:Glucokinase n=1 Tax=Qingshengfaniella alkalisoli TaxID=2599296 RepID=A0A5B8I5T4_9RHOB|nr:glucokinase [Qingshengfaniella alkalisoli]QDY68735.1 glucokinase [Qingshengfaniella alkalisoli]